MAEQILTLTDVSKFYTGAQSVVVGLNSVSLTFSRGEFVAVTGESGSGKSTLSHVIGGILPYESGELLFNGSPTSHFDGLDWERYRRDNVSFISQSYGILPGATVLKNVISALLLSGMDKAAAGTAAEQILRQVELWDMKGRRAAKLSSGQKQRLSIARALAKPAPILIADEPTGNLDAENSAKVIDLLAQAAKDRLVILVTHEFDEAKDLATRHIVLQDGKVASDTPLRPAAEPGPAPSVPVKQKRALSPYVARLQASSRPVWTTIMAVFFAVTAFAVFAFLGVFIISLDDTSTRIYDNSAFLNGTATRIVVQRGDAGVMTPEDHDAILSVSHAEQLDPWGSAADAQYAYRPGVDYEVFYTLGVTTDSFFGDVVESWTEESYRMLSSAPFAQTVPVLKNGEFRLTEGRLPESFYEVVSADPDYAVGDTVKVFLWDGSGIGRSNWIDLEMTVVGATEHGSGLYFSDDVGRFLRQSWEVDNADQSAGFLYLPIERLPAVYVKDGFTETDVLDDSHFLGNSGMFYRRFYKTQESFEIMYGVSSEEYAQAMIDFPALTFTADDDPDRSLDLRPYTRVELKTNISTKFLPDGTPYEDVYEYYQPYYAFHNSSLTQLLHVSYAAFDTLTWQESDQVSLTIENYAYTDRVISALNKLGYAAVSPYRLGSTTQDPDLAAQREQTLKVCLLALLAVVALQVVVLRALFSVETESYLLLSNIGLTGQTAKLSVLWQTLAFTVLGQLIGALGIWLCGLGGVERIQELLRWLPAPYVLLLSGVHLAAAALAAVWTIRALERQVYPLAGKYSDLELDDDGKEDAQ